MFVEFCRLVLPAWVTCFFMCYLFFFFFFCFFFFIVDCFCCSGWCARGGNHFELRCLVWLVIGFVENYFKQ